MCICICLEAAAVLDLLTEYFHNCEQTTQTTQSVVIKLSTSDCLPHM